MFKGEACVGGAALMVTAVPLEIHPWAFCTVTLYVFGVTPVKIGDD